MLQLGAKKYRDVAIRITFADAITVPALLCFEHAPTPTAPFVLLGQVPLQPKSTKQLKHVFRLGADITVKKCLRITCLGHIAKKHSGVHSVSHLLVTGEVAPPSPPPVVPAESFTSSGSTVKQTLVEAEEEENETASSVPVETVAFHNVSLDAGKPPAIKVVVDGAEKADDGGEKVLKNEKKKAAPPPAPPLPAPGVKPAVISSKKNAAAPPPPPPPPPAPSLTAGSRLPPGKVGPVPSRPTLKLFWDKVQPRESIIQRTVWGQLPESSSENKNLEIDFAQLEEEFAAKVNPLGSKKTSSATVRNAAAGPRLVTLNRANNVGAMLARLKLSPEDAKRALLRLVGDDDEEETEEIFKKNNSSNNSLSGRVLGLEELESILPCMPTEDERRLLVKYEGNMEGLTPCERFMLSVLPVPALQARLQAIVFLHSFDSRAAAVGEAAGSVTAACTEVRESSLLRSILKAALTIGNFLNAGNRAGSAAGFQVDTLLKLRDIKSTASRSKTLLHFLAREISRQNPGCISLASELPTCRVASRIALGDLRAELDALAEGIEAAHRAGRDGGADVMHLDELLSVATERLAGVNTSVVEADAAFMELRSFLNSKPSTMDEPAAFFTLLATFCTQLDVAHAENAALDGAGPSSAPASVGSTNPEPRNTNNTSDGGIQQGVRHSMGSSFLPPTSTSAASTLKKEESATTMEAPPLQQRDDVLSTIRAYSRLTADQRKTLLTDKGAKDRVAALGIAHRHSVAAPTGLADFFQNNKIGVGSATDGGLGVIQEQGEEEENKATAVRMSAPAISLAAMLAHEVDATSDADVPADNVVEEKEETNASSLLITEMEGSLLNTEVIEESSCSFSEEVEDNDGSGELEDTSPAAVLSSPVARILASSLNLVEDVVLRSSTLTMQQQEQQKEEEKALPREATAVVQVPNDDAAITAGGGGDLSPVTLRPLGRASEYVSVSPQATPHVKWNRKSLGSDDDGNADVVDSNHNAAISTPEGLVLPCSASLQPVPANDRIWRSSVAALEVPKEEAPIEVEGSSAAAAAIASSSLACLSHENPMVSAPTSLQFGYHGTTAAQKYDTALEDDAGSPEKPARGRGAGGATAVVRQRFEEDEEEIELCCSTQWVQHSAATTAAVPGAAAAAAKVRGSKRVSFSLPNSPRGSFSGKAEDEEEEQQQVQQEQDEDQFVESPCAAPSPVLQKYAHEPMQEQQHSQISHGSIGSKQQRVSIPGLDLNLAKQLVKNASQVKKSRDTRSYSEQQQQSYHSHPQGMHQSIPPGDTYVREFTPTPFVDSGALTPSPGGTSSRTAPSVQDQAAEVLSKAFAAQLRRSLPGLPGLPSDSLPAFPLALSPANMDQIMAAIISNAGNTPTGPLARGVRQGDAHLFDDAAIEVLRAAAVERLAAAEFAQPGQEHKALLEPIVPAPLGMGVRVSETVAHGISPSTLRHSLEAHLRQLQQTSQSQSQQQQHPSSRADTTAAANIPLNVSMVTAAQGPTPAPSYREEIQEDPVQPQQQHSMSYTSGSYGGCLDASYAPSVNPSKVSDYRGSNPVVATQNISGVDAGAGADLRLSGSRQSSFKSGSVREVHSSLAQERIARWNSSQMHGASSSGAGY